MHNTREALLVADPFLPGVVSETFFQKALMAKLPLIPVSTTSFIFQDKVESSVILKESPSLQLISLHHHRMLHPFGFPPGRSFRKFQERRASKKELFGKKALLNSAFPREGKRQVAVETVRMARCLAQNLWADEPSAKASHGIE